MVKNTLFSVMKNYTLLCKGLNNYYTWLCHFESILSLLKNEKNNKSIGLENFTFIKFNSNYFIYFHSI
jgi:hypothetical protein